MQTFLPYANFSSTARVLDYRRLGKQRVEAKQILQALEKRRLGLKGGWINHPAVIMWEGHDDVLKIYHDEMIKEWIRRGYRNTMPLMAEHIDWSTVVLPGWHGHPQLHASHRWRLFEKDPVHYEKFGFGDERPQPYYWPR